MDEGYYSIPWHTSSRLDFLVSDTTARESIRELSEWNDTLMADNDKLQEELELAYARERIMEAALRGLRQEHDALQGQCDVFKNKMKEIMGDFYN